MCGDDKDRDDGDWLGGFELVNAESLLLCAGQHSPGMDKEECSRTPTGYPASTPAQTHRQSGAQTPRPYSFTPPHAIDRLTTSRIGPATASSSPGTTRPATRPAPDRTPAARPDRLPAAESPAASSADQAAHHDSNSCPASSADLRLQSLERPSRFHDRPACSETKPTPRPRAAPSPTHHHRRDAQPPRADDDAPPSAPESATTHPNPWRPARPMKQDDHQDSTPTEAPRSIDDVQESQALLLASSIGDRQDRPSLPELETDGPGSPCPALSSSIANALRADSCRDEAVPRGTLNAIASWSNVSPNTSRSTITSRARLGSRSNARCISPSLAPPPSRLPAPISSELLDPTFFPALAPTRCALRLYSRRADRNVLRHSRRVTTASHARTSRTSRTCRSFIPTIRQKTLCTTSSATSGDRVIEHANTRSPGACRRQSDSAAAESPWHVRHRSSWSLTSMNLLNSLDRHLYFVVRSSRNVRTRSSAS
jgi:hypothetical protein